VNARREDAPIRVGVSSCLLGEEVRWDGGHKRARYLCDVLANHFDWVPVCPEVESGMGIPRPAVRLTRKETEIRMVDPKSGKDHTRAMRGFVRRRVRDLEKLDLCGYLLKAGSPSCGMERVRVYGEKGMPRKDGRGLYADALIERFGSLPVEDEGRLHDPHLRENWIERVFAYRRLRSFLGAQEGSFLDRLVGFHTAHKLQLMAHSPAHYRSLGRLVAEAKGVPRAELRSRYERGFMAALSRPATPRRHQNTLQHALGHLRGRTGGATSRSLHRVIEDYGAGLVPLVVPITMLRHYVELLGIDYLAGQMYLEPHPAELMLRNHV
jgi:uncharacterized protein YbgA (DUF1722 family)/uncharacterized protein YbbK (DUF523 family)